MGSGNRATACLLNYLNFATLAALAAKPWAAPTRKAWPHLTAFNFGTEQCLTASSIWAGDLLACVDGARDAGRSRVALVPFLGVRSFYPPPRRYAKSTINGVARGGVGRAPAGTPGPVIRHYLQ